MTSSLLITLPILVYKLFSFTLYSYFHHKQLLNHGGFISDSAQGTLIRQAHYTTNGTHELTNPPVPGSSMRFLEKSRGINVDTIAYDLEDSVTPGKKAEARRNLKEILSRERSPTIKEQAVRINSVDSGYALDDLTELVPLAPLSLLFPLQPSPNPPSPLQSSKPPTSTPSSSQK